MKPTLTLLALLVAGVINLQAQTPASKESTAKEPTANEAAWNALIGARIEAGATNPALAAATTPEAIAIKDKVMEGSTMTNTEAIAVGVIAKANGGEAALREAFRAIAASSKTGAGVSRARAGVKFWDRDMTGWTDEMLDLRPDQASMLAMSPEATPEFRLRVWNVIKDRSAHNCRGFFKAYRATFPKPVQIEITQKQKDILLALPIRDAKANAWLAEMSADLIALQLDQ
jgi:hypothetical protein